MRKAVSALAVTPVWVVTVELHKFVTSYQMQVSGNIYVQAP